MPLKQIFASGRSGKGFCADSPIKRASTKETVKYSASDLILPNAEPSLFSMRDVAQPNQYSCGACAAMVVANYFGVGSRSIAEWEKLLGTSEADSTAPASIVAEFVGLGLTATARQWMTIDDLRENTLANRPVIVCVSEYGDRREKGASWTYGHYLVVLRCEMGMVFCRDSSVDNVMHGSEAANAPGLSVIEQGKFERIWKDENPKGVILKQFGIIVSGQK